MDYTEFFERATGEKPFPYQTAFQEADWPDIVDVPTGLGKTAAVAVSWLYGRRIAPSATPMRLVWCLPMRTLVEQTHDVIERWIANTAELFGSRSPTVHKLMGGEVDVAWAEHPEHPSVIVGTQDMLLSRALMRGYGMRRYDWPIHFAFLNNDALWVYDEIQLMGVAVETSAQLDAFRRDRAARATRSIWMSATVGLDQLDTIDHPRAGADWQIHSVSPADRADPHVRQRLEARKVVQKSPITVPRKKDSALPAKIAERVLEAHQEGTLTLVVCNRVARAVAIYEQLLKHGRSEDTTALLHSRFRPVERAKQLELLNREGDRIIVSTQVVEAGVDISAQTLFTELAPWPSLVQRIGRCNRRGETVGTVEWFDIECESDKDDVVLPYSFEELDAARSRISALEDASPASVAEVAYEPPFVVRPVVRRKDVDQLFDTSADLTGADVDVSRWVRDDTDTDVSFFWRDLGGEPPGADTPGVDRRELCRVSLKQADGFAKALRKKKIFIWCFDLLDRKWVRAHRIRPGGTFMLSASAGGYDERFGFTADLKDGPVSDVSIGAAPEEGFGDDGARAAKTWLGLTQHLRDVEEAARGLADALRLDETWTRRLETAARWHDVGKAHPEFQRRLIEPAPDEPLELGDQFYAKSNHGKRARDAGRRYFRHELASTLAFLQRYDGPDTSLIAYLIAAHHGKVRLSIRSMPDEVANAEYFAMGVHHGDELQLPTDDGNYSDTVTLDLSIMRMGEGSWRERTLGLLEEHGPFQLAWWESLVRIADWRGSARGEQ